MSVTTIEDSKSVVTFLFDVSFEENVRGVFCRLNGCLAARTVDVA